MSLSLDPATIEAPPPRGPNPLHLLVRIWVRPRQALRDVAEGPGWLWVVPLLLALMLLMVRVFVGAPLQVQARLAQVQAMQEARMADMPSEVRETLPPEALQMPEIPQAAIIAPALIAGLSAILLGWLLRAALLHIGSMALGGRQGFGVLYRVSAWAGLPLVLRDAVQAVYMQLTHELIQGPGLSGLVASPAEPTSNGLSSLFAGTQLTATGIFLSKLDLYTIWYLILLALAVRAASNLSRGKALVVVGLYAFLALLPSFVPLLVFGVLGGM
jgi:hypothetical protein